MAAHDDRLQHALAGDGRGQFVDVFLVHDMAWLETAGVQVFHGQRISYPPPAIGMLFTGIVPQQGRQPAAQATAFGFIGDHAKCLRSLRSTSPARCR